MSMAHLLFWIGLLAGDGMLSGYRTVVEHVPGRVITAETAQLKDGGGRDLLVFWREGFPPAGRTRLSIFRQQAGKLSTTPDQVLGLPESTVGFEVADANGDGRDDVLLLDGEGLSGWLAAGDGRLAEKPTRLIAVMTSAALAHEDHIPPLSLVLRPAPLPQPCLLLPTVPLGPLSLYCHESGSGFVLKQVLRVPSRGNLYSAAEDARALRDIGLWISLQYPRVVVADADGDGRMDLFFFSQDTLTVFRQRPGAGFPTHPDLYRIFGMLSPEERIQISTFVRGDVLDWNNDGRADVVFAKATGSLSSMKSEVRLFFGRPDGSFPDTASQSFRRDGYSAALRIADVDGDRRAEIVYPFVSLGLTSFIQMLVRGRLTVDFEVYTSQKGGLERKPGFSIEVSFGVNTKASQEISGVYPLVGQDFDGDGHPDLVVGQAGKGSNEQPDHLEIRLGNGAGHFSEDPSQEWDVPSLRQISAYPLRPGDRASLVLVFSATSPARGDVWVLQPNPAS